MVTISFLVAGIAALVPGSPNEVRVLLPRVEREYWQQCGSHLPTHEAHLAFACKDWDHSKCPKDILTSAGDSQICWIKLARDEVSLEGTGPQRPGPDPDVWLMFQRNLPRNADVQLKALDWLPEMSDLDRRYAEIPAPLFEGDPDGFLQARARFQYSRRRSCGFVGQTGMEPGLEGDDRPGFSIPMYVFKRNRNDSSFARRTQALAAGGLFEIEVADAGAVKLVLTPIDQPDQVTCTLELSDDRSEGTVDLGLVQLVHNWEALGHAVRVALGNHREGRDSHFRPYYWLSDSAGACNQSGKPAALPVPFRTHWFRRVPERRLKEVCPSSILFSAEEFRKHYTIANVLTWFASPKPDSESPMPESATAFFSKEWEWEDIKVGMTVSPIKSPAGYSLMNVVGPPLCTPMRMEKGEE